MLAPYTGQLVLYRAVVDSRKHNMEMVVFFEAARERRHEVLNHLLHTAWAVDVEADVQAYNVCSEQELITDHAWGDACTGDLRLFECGTGPAGVCYVQPWRVQFFVNPTTLQRLLLAYWQVPLQPAACPAARDMNGRMQASALGAAA